MKDKYKRLKDKLKGPIFSIVTPFIEGSEEIDFSALNRYIEYAFSVGARNFYVMGYNSRFSQLSWEEIKDLNDFVVQRVKSLSVNNIVIVADPLHCSTKTSIEFCKHAEEIGADIISLIFREKYYSNEQVYNHYKMCANSCSIGILLHEMPFISGYGGHTINWPIDLLDQIADFENLIAIKEDTKDDEYSYEVIKVLKDRLSIIISGGGKRQWLQFSKMGCESWLNGIGVFEPKIAIAFWEAYKSGNSKKTKRIIDEIEIPFFEKGVKKYGWHLAVKAALELRGHFPRNERMPMMPISEEGFNDIKKWFNKLPIDSLLDD